ncbi:hypothetical protein PLESTB_001632700 [Pleodorina starrii]|uniref:Uncharacterized protein n=1 Tax=Pleodorina starrii TaxID=330485 RepID=A0A9W6BYG7_9CHLO|nr:hypothetical protein PLESTM_000973600 [Pleodorina starrii]GLC60602.1 hypothetical protein PLESTB_001632700 [Pleodorina starrii]GLC76664.1 hypothetical protein PLESTF_001814700 [Pleodorina starrii]
MCRDEMCVGGRHNGGGGEGKGRDPDQHVPLPPGTHNDPDFARPPAFLAPRTAALCPHLSSHGALPAPLLPPASIQTRAHRSAAEASQCNCFGKAGSSSAAMAAAVARGGA